MSNGNKRTAWNHVCVRACIHEEHDAKMKYGEASCEISRIIKSNSKHDKTLLCVILCESWLKI